MIYVVEIQHAAAKVNDARSRLLDAAMPASRTIDSGESNRLIPRKRILKALIAVHPTGQLLRELPFIFGAFPQH